MKSKAAAISALFLLVGCNSPAQANEPSANQANTSPVAAFGPWAVSFTTYGWLPWISGDLTVKGRSFDVDVTAGQVIDALDWSGIPAWFSYAEARNGRLSLFNDVVYAKLDGSRDFAKTGPLGAVTLSGNVDADYEQTIVELGAAYEIWSAGTAMGPAGFDFVAGARYWHQSSTVSADLSTTVNLDGLIVEGNRVLAKSGSVDWVDPFIGVRFRQALANGQSVNLRGDIGGFDVGSDVTWQVVASYNFQICTTDSYAIDGYVGYRALSVDYSQGAGSNRYEFDAIMQGPVVGASLRF